MGGGWATSGVECQSLVPNSGSSRCQAASQQPLVFPPPPRHPAPTAKRHKGISRARIWEELPIPLPCYLTFLLKILSVVLEAFDFMILRAQVLESSSRKILEAGDPSPVSGPASPAGRSAGSPSWPQALPHFFYSGLRPHTCCVGGRWSQGLRRQRFLSGQRLGVRAATSWPTLISQLRLSCSGLDRASTKPPGIGCTLRSHLPPPLIICPGTQAPSGASGAEGNQGLGQVPKFLVKLYPMGLSVSCPLFQVPLGLRA